MFHILVNFLISKIFTGITVRYEKTASYTVHVNSKPMNDFVKYLVLGASTRQTTLQQQWHSIPFQCWTLKHATNETLLPNLTILSFSTNRFYKSIYFSWKHTFDTRRHGLTDSGQYGGSFNAFLFASFVGGAAKIIK